MLLFFAQAVTAIPRLSLTADEPVYIGAGYAFLRSGDLRLATQAQHPPLMQEIVALPLLLRPGPDLDQVTGWETDEMGRFAPAFVAWYEDQLDGMSLMARMPVVLIGLLWAATLFRWAADWFGPWGGIAALTLFAFDPNVLAHATLSTTDVGFAAFSLIAIFAATRFLRRPSWPRLALTGLALGASLSAKSSGFFTVLALAVLFPLMPLITGERSIRRLAERTGQFALALFLGLLVLWASYGFESRPLVQNGVPIPLATQWEVWREMGQHLDAGHTAYLMGNISKTGWRTYYPLAFALKTPPVTLTVITLGLIVALAGGPRRWLEMAPLWVYLGGYTAATLLSRVNTGYRFLLPALPFGFILAGGLFHNVARRRSPTLCRLAWIGLVAAGLVTVTPLHPHYLTYFNVWAGGPSNGHRYLVDSNLDWGQSFKALKSYLDEQDVEQIQLSYYTYADPALYGIDYQPLPPAPDAPPVLARRFDPAPGVYVIGATTLQGVMLADPDTFDWFRHREPLGRPGTALFVYRVEAHAAPPGWLAQCTLPLAPLTDAAIEEGVGRDGLRIAHFDCTAGWLYPQGTGSGPWGWYALLWDTARDGDPFIQAHLSENRLSYEQRRAGSLPPFQLYEAKRGRVAPPVPAEIPLGVGDLTFLGHGIASSMPARPGQMVDMETWWRVERGPERPLSLMLHLMGPDGAPVAVGDGLAVPIEQWRAGDVLVQRHRLAVPEDAPAGAYSPVTGVYWLDTLERWPVEGPGGPIGDQIVLDAIPVGR